MGVQGIAQGDAQSNLLRAQYEAGAQEGSSRAPMPRKLPDAAFVAPARLAVQVAERLAVLDRVRPILSDAIHDAKGEEAITAVAILGIRIMSAILKE